jgi:CDP-diacylglycerol--glycerol-3-phosphate 3-phosphatidyltransferase
MKPTLPNLITVSRALLAPLFFFLYVAEVHWAVVASAVVFIAAAVTDYLDGWLARKYDEYSDWGRVNDPLADKILTTAAFVAFAWKGYAAWWMVGIIILRDVGTTWLRAFADSIHKPMATSFSAKSKTFAQLTVIIVVLVFEAALRLPLPAVLHEVSRWVLHPALLSVLMLGITIFTAWTGVEYCLSNRAVTCRLWWKVRYKVGKVGKTIRPRSPATPRPQDRLALILASVFGVGFVPKAPGTAGSVAALVILLIPSPNPLWLLLIAIVVGSIIGLMTVPIVEARYGNDPSCVVIDEAVGMWLVLLSPWVPHTPLWVVAGFALFRLFDIWKPFPARWFNERSGSVAVMMDDVVAAAYAWIVLHAAWWFGLQTLKI